jgi:hypothetical protein
MPGAVKRHPGVTNSMGGAVVDRDQVDRAPQPLPQDRFAGAHRPIFAAAGPGVIGVGVGDQGPGHRPHRIDPGRRRPAVEPLGGVLQQAAGGKGHLPMLHLITAPHQAHCR